MDDWKSLPAGGIIQIQCSVLLVPTHKLHHPYNNDEIPGSFLIFTTVASGMSSLASFVTPPMNIEEEL